MNIYLCWVKPILNVGFYGSAKFYLTLKGNKILLNTTQSSYHHKFQLCVSRIYLSQTKEVMKINHMYTLLIEKHLNPLFIKHFFSDLH